MRKFENVRGLMYSVANSMKFRHESAGDFVQDAWIIGNLHKCHEHELQRTIYNDMLRSRQNRCGMVGSAKREVESGTVPLSTAMKDGDIMFNQIDKSLRSLEDKEIFNKLLNLLSFREYVTVFWYISKGRSFDDISSEWDVSVGIVHLVYHRSLEKMRESKLIRDIR